MGFWDWLRNGRGHGLGELARRLGISEQDLQLLTPSYREFTVPKRSGGVRRIHDPEPVLKDVQRCILRRLLARLKAHPAATGFERGRSIVTNARPHVGQAVLLRLDLRDFFTSTRSARVRDYFRRIGWNRPAAKILTRLCTWEESLPQGSPCSPRLSNLVNFRLDARLAGIARRFGGVYTRYADDITVSFAQDDGRSVRTVQSLLARALRETGYRIHRRKLSHRRRHQRQLVTGLVVNERVQLPREVRRWLRAVDHRLHQPSQGSGPEPTLSPTQRAGWRALERMIRTQAAE